MHMLVLFTVDQQPETCVNYPDNDRRAGHCDKSCCLSYVIGKLYKADEEEVDLRCQHELQGITRSRTKDMFGSICTT